jgi:hypothetical protein
MKPNDVAVSRDHSILEFVVVAIACQPSPFGHHSLAVIPVKVLRQEVWFVPFLDWVAQNGDGLFADKCEPRGRKLSFPWKNMRDVQQELKA